MSKITTSKKQQDQLVVNYPKDKDVKINGANLKSELDDFKKAVKNEVNIPLIITLLSLWGVVFGAKFNDVLGITGHDIQVGFTVLAAGLTLILVKPFIISFFRIFANLRFFQKKFPSLRTWCHKNETDPERKAKSIIKISKK